MRPTDLLFAFLAAATVCFASAAGIPLAGAGTGWDWSGWAGLHLALLGGVSLLVIGVSQFFVTAFLATDPPSRRMVNAQIGTWIPGSIAVVIGVAASVDFSVVVGAVLLLTTLLFYAISLSRLRSRSLQRALWASRWYATSAGWLVPGILIGVLLALRVSWTDGSLLGSHLALNLAGWVGGAIVGTLHTFAPSLTQTTLRFPSFQKATFASWNGGVLILALGYGSGSSNLGVAGWALLLCGACLLAANLLASGLKAKRPLSLPARLVLLAQVFLPLALALGLVAALDHPLEPIFGHDRAGLAVLLLIGWVGLTVTGSMLHLLSVVVRVRDLTRPVPTPGRLWRTGIAVAALGGAGLLALAELLPLEQLIDPARLVIALALVLLAGSVVRAVVLAFKLGHGR